MESQQHCQELNHQIDVLRQRMELLQGNASRQGSIFFPLQENKMKITDSLAAVVDNDHHAGREKVPCKDELGEVLDEAGTLCHQLNQPIQCVSGYTELILMDLPEDDPIFDRLSTISVQVQRMTEITRQLMDFIRRKRTLQNA